MQGHLPPVESNLDVVGELEVDGEFGDVVPGQIADLSVFKDYAYLNSWDEPSCTRGGTYIADISDPTAPQEIGFLPAQTGYYHGEGAHVVSIDTPQFTGDLLAVNDEACTNAATRPPDVPQTAGGFDLYDVTDPENPVTLGQNFGDTTLDASLEPDPDPDRLPNSYHSVFVWQDGPQAFLVGVDNTEFGDVDIYNITDPTDPEMIADLDLVELFPQIVDESAYGNAIFHHDMIVKKVGNTLQMISSYWDAGYVQLDVTNPAAPTYITDTNFDDPDPLFGFDPPEGNAHQSEYSHDNEFILAADEDFSPFRLKAEITEAPFAGEPITPAISAAEPIEDGTTITEDTEFVGDACAPLPPPTPGVGAAVAERGTCNFQVKIDNIEDAGYDLIIIFNNSWGGGGGRCESLINMLVDPDTTDIPALFLGRADALKVLGTYDENTYQCTGAATETPADTDVPAVGTQGLTVEIGTEFDGWGYAHLYDATTSEELDAFAIPEARDDRFATGFGDLSIHEFATDPTEDLAYSSYYAGGIRVLSYDREDGLKQKGAWIGENGSNFWGIEQFTTPGGKRLIAGSDRDFGLVILEYTGAGAPVAPSCASVNVTTPQETPVFVPLNCTDANGNTLTLEILTEPVNGTLGPIVDNQVEYTPEPGYIGEDEFTYAANDGAADSTPALVNIAVTDGDPPETEITKHPKKRTAKHKAKFKFTSDEEGSSFECQLDDSGYQACESPFKDSVGKGKHTFSVRAVDVTGNVDPTPAEWTWRVTD
ncbi:MAG: hypothetical protein QOI31_1420 [Solirubrobacterales bacterium]|nr:hypothetical protein [Solirubrobacterales bacterium]